ncbi:hypothetical protein SAMD00019534_069330 [Acytostelium subglobosum LB1]|uniref:hypothetical protein n=1 Tax=Acytostelium subglobosum LB1 TaxID=1410327 RepID=UPI000644C614|nr:hypothetical protein SAMD00019534_069330 [Acytostelium subglobosum LB1]GAM23758.1 hypothetical protein SAMD00019534_069330 [Acytostelium subglobosum LB1]|eukprot:XP_012753499.1 hypothetical protein SAMD00019534_069330 [Acytostelium subglobosum LB1]
MSMINSAISTMFNRTNPHAAHLMKRAQRGLYGGRLIQYGNTISFSHRKTRRNWLPNAQMKTYHSDVLGTDLRVNVTTYTIRCIDKAGSFDNYILYTKDKDLQSELGSDLKILMKTTMQQKVIEQLELAESQQQQQQDGTNVATA